MSSLIERDRQYCWHPYTQHGVEPEPMPVVGARGAELTLADGRTLIDAISSWWAILHGHGEPALLRAMTDQGETMDHVLFAGTTHPPAVDLAERLLEVVPPGLARVFYSDDGSTAVEVALKMVLQRWVHLGEGQRQVFVALDGAYHGDTFGAMAVGDPGTFFKAFEPLFFEVRRVPADAEALAQVLDELGPRAAGFILEPLVQGAAGMVMHSPEFVRSARTLCDERGLPMIADEVMTGFGRTGSLFATSLAGITPDVLCLAKGLTGGLFPLSATLCTAEIYEAFHSDDRGRAFFHGHTFTAHPIGCAVALASLELCQQRDVPGRLDALGARIEKHLADASLPGELRRRGGIVALELPADDSGYLAKMGLPWRQASVERGVLLRPLGNVLYSMPPACTSDAQADRIAEVMIDLVRGG